MGRYEDRRHAGRVLAERSIYDLPGTSFATRVRYASSPPRLARALRVRLEGVELLAPKRLHLIEPPAQRSELLAPEAVDAHARVVLQAVLLDEAGAAQHAQRSEE